jgi:hypothetical protein
MIIDDLLSRIWVGMERQQAVHRERFAPLKQQLKGSVPALLTLLFRIGLATNAPVAFHRFLLNELDH